MSISVSEGISTLEFRADDREGFFERKPAAKDKRKNNAHKRTNSWDNFAEKSDAEREEEAPLT
jgi:hypothetical protein